MKRFELPQHRPQLLSLRDDHLWPGVLLFNGHDFLLNHRAALRVDATGLVLHRKELRVHALAADTISSSAVALHRAVFFTPLISHVPRFLRVLEELLQRLTFLTSGGRGDFIGVHQVSDAPLVVDGEVKLEGLILCVKRFHMSVIALEIISSL